MTIKKLFPIITVCLVITIAFFSCKLDPWTSGKMPTDVVVITKTTNTAGLHILVGQVTPPDGEGPVFGCIGQSQVQEGVAIQFFIVVGRSVG